MRADTTLANRLWALLLVQLATTAVPLPATASDGARVLLTTGREAIDAGRYDEASARFDEARRVAKDSGDQRLLARIIKEQGTLHLARGRLDDAESTLSEALALATTLDDAWLTASTHISLAGIHEQRRDRAGALIHYRYAANALETLDRPAARAAALQGVGLQYWQAQIPSRAQPKFEEAITLARKHQLDDSELAGLRALAPVLAELGDADALAPVADRLETLARRKGVPDVVTRAAEYRERARNLSLAAGDPELDRFMAETRALMAAGSMRSLAFELTEQGAVTLAEELVRESLALAQQYDHADYERSSLEQLGALLLHLGRYQQAEETFGLLRAAAERRNDKRAQAAARSQIGIVSSLRGDPDTAKQHFDAVLLFAREHHDLELRGQAANGLALVAFAHGEYREALTQWQRASAATQSQAGVPARIAGLQLELIARASAMLGEHANALRQAERALANAERSGLPQDLSSASDTLGFVHFRAGRLADAEQHLRLARERYAQVRRAFNREVDAISAFDVHSIADDLLLHVLDSRARKDTTGARSAEMLVVADTGKAPAHVAALAKRHGAALPFDVARLRQTVHSLGVTVVEYALLYDPTTVVVADRLRGRQAHREALLVIWVIRPDGSIEIERVDLAARRQAGQPSVDTLVAGARANVGAGRGTAITNRPIQDRAVWRQLYDLLIEPIAEHLAPGVTDPEAPAPRLVVVPHGALALVPFAALEATDGGLLLERFTVSLAPSVEALALRSVNTMPVPAGSRALVVGDPELTDATRDLDRLPGAHAEAIAIAQLLDAEPLIGEEATKHAVVEALTRAPMVHLACHGLLEHRTDDAGWRGALALASPSGDGLLSAQEIAAMYIPARLAVLSACDTGSGRVTADGVLGLARAFLAAGTRSVVVSLWRVDDSATADLMRHFYARLAAGDNPASALRSAQLAIRSEYPDPRYWAAFVSTGR